LIGQRDTCHSSPYAGVSSQEPPDFSDNLNEGTGRQIGRWDVFAAVFPSVSRWPGATGLWCGQRDQRAVLSPARKPAPPDPQRVFLPRGLLGRLGGRLMARGLPQQREIADLLSNPGTNALQATFGDFPLSDQSTAAPSASRSHRRAVCASRDSSSGTRPAPRAARQCDCRIATGTRQSHSPRSLSALARFAEKAPPASVAAIGSPRSKRRRFPLCTPDPVGAPAAPLTAPSPRSQRDRSPARARPGVTHDPPSRQMRISQIGTGRVAVRGVRRALALRAVPPQRRAVIRPTFCMKLSSLVWMSLEADALLHAV